MQKAKNMQNKYNKVEILPKNLLYCSLRFLKGGDIMLFGNGNGNLIAFVKRELFEESSMLKNGFSKMEKCRCIGRIDGFSKILRFCGINETEINTIVTRGTEVAESNLLHYNNNENNSIKSN